MEHVVAADLVGAVRETVRVLVARRLQQQLGRVGGAARDDDDVAREPLLGPVPLDDHLADGGAFPVRLEPHDLRVRQQRHVRVLEGRPNAEHLGVGLRVHEAGEAVAGRTADAGRERRVRLVEHDPARRVERVVAGCREVVGELLDPRLVRHGGMRIGRAGRRLGRVLAARAVHLVELLRERVVRLQLVVRDRPGRRDAVVVAKLPEVLLAQAVERGAVELRRSTDEVVDTGLEGLAARVVPRVRRDVAVVHEHVLVRPVLRLARKPVAALEQEDPLAGRGEVAGERAAAGAGADDDHVVGVHGLLLQRGFGLARQYCASISGTMIRAAASSSARCENACGKLPRCRPVSASNSSA